MRYCLLLSHVSVKNGADLKNEAAYRCSWQTRQQPIISEIGEELARKINAVKYIECSSFDVTEIDNVFQEAVLFSLCIFEEIRRYHNEKSNQKQGFFKRFLNLFGKSLN